MLRGVGIASPFIYFATIGAGWLFNPGFDPVRQVSSELGSRDATLPLVFNSGFVLFGLSIIAIGVLIHRALWDLGSRPARAAIVSGVFTIFGCATVGAGLFPLPDWKHAVAASFGLPIVVGPGLMAFALRGRPDLRGFRLYLVGTNGVMVLAIGAYLALAVHGYPGLGQLLYSLTAVPWIGVSAAVLSGTALRGVGSSAPG
jgi:hypothetical membrane protein